MAAVSARMSRRSCRTSLSGSALNAGYNNTILTGVAYGGGVKYAIPTASFLNPFHSSAATLKVEYLHYDLGTSNLLVSSCTTAAGPTLRVAPPRRRPRGLRGRRVRLHGRPGLPAPKASVPVSFKEAVGFQRKGWRPATPLDMIDRGPWWQIYRDPFLSALASQVDISNQSVANAAASYVVARETIKEAQASLFPTVTAAHTTTGTHAAGATTITFTLQVAATWDLDVWGRIRRGVESSAAAAQASAADLQNAKLSEQGALLTAYYDLRATDALNNAGPGLRRREQRAAAAAVAARRRRPGRARGSALPAVRVELNPLKLYKYGIGLEDVRAARRASGSSRPR